MATENIKKERFDQLGLPPMELAESSANNHNNNGVYKCLFPVLQKVMIMLLLTIFGASTYVLLSKILENYGHTRSTQIILIKDPPPSMIQFIQSYNTSMEEDNDVITRYKRDTSEINNLDLFNDINVNDDILQKAREIIMKHNVTCSSDEEQQGICQDLVTKLKGLTENNDLTSQSEEAPTISDKNQNDISSTKFRDLAKYSDMATTDVTKREALPIAHINNGLEPVPNNLGLKNISQYGHPHSLPYVHPYTENCLMNLIKRYPRVKGYSDPMSEELNHRESHYGNQLSPHPRVFLPAVHTSYKHASNIDTQRRKFHQQDLDIIMSFLTPKPEVTATDRPANSSRAVSCPEGTKSCLSGDVCVENKQWCDGNVDCDDVSDEAKCNCKSRVDKSRLCDGYFDCPFGEDELGCYGCSESTFSCEDLDLNMQSTCFTKEQRCNNVADCPNRKDEVECNMLAPSLFKKTIFAVSNTEGFLHRNFKGEWYAVCKNPYMWAHDACRRETGLIIRPPFIQIVPIDPMLKMNYINTDTGGLLQTSDSCFNSSAVYVNCPDLLCGTRVQSTPQLLKENTEIENHLFGRNKRFLKTKHPYPLMFYGYRQKRNIDNWRANTNYGVHYDTLKTEDSFDKMRNKRTESRVVGGRPSQPGAWPWLVAVYRNGMFHCGGVVITHSWIISAAHCVHKFWEHYYEVQVGMLRRFSFSPQEQSHKVTHVIVNQHYSQTDMQNDLSLLKVEPAIQFSRWVRPICLPNPDTAGPDWLWAPSPGTMCTAVGWGATAEHGPDPDHMREVEMPIWEKCKHSEDRAGREICAGLVEGGKDACQGDSGGPLLCRNPLNSQQWYMAGIVSHGDGCGRKGEPGVYTRVSLFVKWIRYHTESNTLPIIQPIQDCPGFKCESGISKCLPTKRKCDKIIDCLDGEDEINCEFKRTIPTLFPTPKTNAIEDIFEAKEAEESSDSTNKTISTISPFDTTSFTQEIDTSTKNVETITEKIESVTKNDEGSPDFEHASTFEILIPTSSEESIKYSDEQVTSDPIPERLPTKEFDSSERGDAETFTVEIFKKPPESGSSVLEHQKELTTVKDHEETTEQTTETITSVFTEQTLIDKEGIDTTIQMNLPETSTSPNPTTLDSQESSQEERANKKSENDFIDLLPNLNSDVADQIGAETEEMEKTSSNSNENHRKDGLVKKLPDLDDTIEDIISETQPAKLRRKHHIPKEFQCRRINQMVPYQHRCDRKADCEDGTDELDCSCSDYLATFDNQLICDGVYDCADGHDETTCYSCGDDQFLCKQSQMCLPLKNVCDGRPHCPQGEDELDCFALSNGTYMEFNLDERPTTHFKGFLTKKHGNDWHVVCEDKLTTEQQEQAAANICRYLGFSSANNFYVKYINIREDEISKRSMEIKRIKREVTERIPIHFAYRQESEDNNTARNIVIHDVQIIKEQCVPNITKTCKSLYVICDHSLFTNPNEFQNIYLRNTETVPQIWPWVAKIYVEGEYKCSGVLVDLSWVLVSESCLWDTTFSEHYITAVLGSHRTLDTGNGLHEQVYQVDAKKRIYSKIVLLHLKQPAYYSNVVKPMVVSSSFPNLNSKSVCVAIGEDNKNNTISVMLEETNKHCHPSNHCFLRKSTGNICPPNVSSNRHWAGIISCHTDQGWLPVASFVESRGECGLENIINATDIDNLKNEINRLNNNKTTLVRKNVGADCESTRCSRGRCIPLAQMCDGVRNCEDGNDESESACVKKNNLCSADPYRRGCNCLSGQMKCRNGKCIPKELFRDSVDDCGDGTDEPGQSTCLHYLARVMPSRLCDGILHCEDRSDEDPLYCKCFAKKVYTCGSNLNVDQCVALDMVCDGVRDCPGGEDEQTCIGLYAPPGTPHGTGQVIVRTHGVWYSKCYSKQNHTKSELEAICASLGFISGHAKQIHELEKLITHQHNNVVTDSYKDISLNNRTIIKMRNTQEPIATAIFDEKLENCNPVFIECL